MRARILNSAGMVALGFILCGALSAVRLNATRRRARFRRAWAASIPRRLAWGRRASMR